MKRLLPLCLLAICCLAGCRSEYHMANSFLTKFDRQKKDATEQIYVHLPRTVLHTNSALNAVEDFAQLSALQQDSVIATLTRILDKVNDSIFLSQFNQSLLYTLSRSNIPVVMVDDAARLPVADSQHFVLNILQLEAEEYLQKNYSDFSTRKGVYYHYKYDLRRFSSNVWLSFGDSNVYFKNYELGERFNGTITQLHDNQATLQSHFDRIDVNDAYLAARTLGVLCGQLYIEQLINKHIAGDSTEYYYLYDPAGNSVYERIPADEAAQIGFQRIEK